MLTQRNQQATVRRELLDERRRYLGAPGGDQNRVVGGIGAPPERSVAQQHRNVRDPGLAEGPLGREGEPLHALDRENRTREGREQRRLIP